MSRVLETVLTGRNLLSPMLATASRDVVTFNNTVATAQGKAAVSATTSAQVQDRAADKITASNVKASTSATTSSQAQVRAHARAAESATLSARTQESANRALAASNAMLGTSLTPLTAGLGATALGLAYAGYRGMEFGTAMSRVQAATQQTGSTLEDLRDTAIDAGAKTQYSASEAAGGITEMAKAGVEARDIIGGGLAGALNLAAAGEMDVADAAEIGATALNVFNLRGNQMSHVADLLAAGAGKAQGSVADLGMALNQSALVANATGLSIEETTGSLAAFASAGLIGSDAGTSFRSMLLHLQNPSKESAQTMADLGISMYDANGQFVGMESLAGQLQTRMKGLTQAQRDQAMAQIFGSDAVRAANVLYEQGARGIAEWTGKVDDAGYAARQASQLNDNLRGDLERLGGAFDSVMTTIGGGAQGALREAVQALTAIVNVGGDVIGFFTSLPGPVQAGLVALTAVHVLGGPVTTTIKGIGFAVDVMTASFRNAGGAAGMLKGGATGLLGVFGGPWGLAITGAAVGLSLLVSWLNKTDEATEAASQAQLGLTSALEASKGAIDANVRAAAAKAAQDEGILDAMEAAGLSTAKVTDAILNQGNALSEVGVEMIRYRDARVWGSEADKLAAQSVNEAWAALQQLAGSTDGTVADAQQIARAQGEVGTAMQGAAVLTEEAAKAEEDWLNTVSTVLAGYVDPLDTYKGLLDERAEAERAAAEKTAAATKDSSDSWKDYVTDVGVSLDEYAAKLEEQLTAQENWRDNIVRVTQRGGMEVGQILLNMGEEGAGLVQQMVDANDADFARLRDLMIRDARAGGDGASKALDNSMKFMTIIGRDGSKATRSAISKELQIGVGEVQRIADQYGVKLASGINPVLSAIGKKVITLHQQAGRTYVGMNAYHDGGYTGPGGKYEPAGIVHKDEYVVTKERTAKLGVRTLENLERILPGYAGGGFVSAADVPRPPSTAPYRAPISTAADGVMGKEYAEVTAWLKANQEPLFTGGGTATASSSALVALGRPLLALGAGVSEHPAFGGVTRGAHVRGSKHYSGRAIDVNTRAGTSALEQRELAPMMAQARAAGFQVIFMSEGHYNHGHVASYKTGTPYVPADGLAYLHQGERVVPREQNVAPAAMPGYGRVASPVVVHHHHYDQSRRTDVSVDARGFNADVIADRVVARQQEREFLSD